MFKWSKNYNWNFSNAGPTLPNQGPAITGTKIFRGGHFKNVVRETIQNSLDAKDPMLPGNCPVRVEFELMHLGQDDVPGAEELSRAIDLCYDYISSMDGVKLDDVKVLKDASDQLLKKSPVPVLRISDYNTVGLNEKNYVSLMDNEGLTPKTDEDSAGSFGFGKFAPYLLSPVNTVLYGSRTDGDTFRFIGRALLSTFKDEGSRKMGTSLFGCLSDEGDRILAINAADDVPSIFRRTEKGTDLYILCFDREDDWMNQTAFSVLENFFYAIWKEKLIVALKDEKHEVVFDSTNVGDMICDYRELYEEKYANEEDSFSYTAPIFWNVINNNVADGPIVFGDFRGKGEVLLYLRMGEGVEGRQVLRMRNSGMKIDIETRYDRLPPFNAVLVATGEGKRDEDYNGNISKFLRELESPAHDNWATENITKPEIMREARLVIKELHSSIREEVKKRMPKDDGTPVDVFGLSRILPNVVEEGTETLEENAVFNFVPETVEIKAIENKKKTPLKSDTNGRGKKKRPDPKPKPDPKPDREIQHRNNRQRKKPTAVPIMLRDVKTPYIQSKNTYRVSVVSEENVSELLLQISICGDDSALFEADVLSAQNNGQKYSLKDGYVHVKDVKAGERYSFDVILLEQGSYALEVKAYAKK